MNNYKNIKFGLTFMGQTTIFKIRLSSFEDELYTKLKAITHWQDNIVTEYKDKKYFTIVGAFHSTNNYKFQLIKNISLNKRKLNQAIIEAASLGQQLKSLEGIDTITVSKDWSEYLTPLDSF